MIDIETPVATVVLGHSACAGVFQRHQIDFCCRGHKSIAVAAAERGVDLDRLVAELDLAILAREPDAFDAQAASTADLITHITARHHGYLREALPVVARLADKVARVHGGHDRRLLSLAEDVQTLASRLLPHLEYEEQVLFPHLLAPEIDPWVVGRELEIMREDHFEVAAVLARMRETAGGFVHPDWACNSYRALFAELHHLESDIFQHVHLENHALLPRFIPQGNESAA